MSKPRIFGIIPARGGSKRLMNKNVFPVHGKPMILYTIDAVRKSRYLDLENVYVSTEDAHIRDLVKPHLKVVDRPAELAEDKVWTQDVVNHFIEVVGIGSDDVVVILQANSPQLTAGIIDQCIEMLLENKLWQVHTVGTDMINNGAVQAYLAKVSHHKGKANYNGVVVADLIDVHTLEDVKQIEKLFKP